MAARTVPLASTSTSAPQWTLSTQPSRVVSTSASKLLGTATCYLLGVVARRRTLVAVHAHPDDETIATGGILARYSAAGVRTVVVTCARGDLGETNGVDLSELSVGEARERELAAAMDLLGVSRVVHLGYLDS